MMASSPPLLQINHLSVDFVLPDRTFTAVRDVTLTIRPGETVALVGESGSGKSVTALSVLGLLPPVARVDPHSALLFQGRDLIRADAATLQRVRGGQIGMIFQEPLTSLNPLHTIGQQIDEALSLHAPTMDDRARKNRLHELLDQVELDSLASRLGAYPHELSGGQRQRVMIAMAIANNPQLLIADEPTTALDVTVQAQILELLHRLKTRLGMAMLLITHDLGIVRTMADQVAVMQGGAIVENRPVTDVMTTPHHDYTRALLAAKPKGPPVPVPSAPQTALRVRDLGVRYPVARTLLGRPTRFVDALQAISFDLRHGHTVGVVGESGSGKSTLGLALMRLVTATGSVTLGDTGDDMMTMKGAPLRSARAKIQMVFQDPFGSLSPRLSVGQIIGEGLGVHAQTLPPAQRDARVIDALDAVRMDPAARNRYPHEFSGGQRQRIALARALVLQPSVVILDEPTSALDVSVQMQIVDLLKELQETKGLAYLFISHDLRVVRALAHDVLVLKDGIIQEQGPAGHVLTTPKSPYTQALLAAALD